MDYEKRPETPEELLAFEREWSRQLAEDNEYLIKLLDEMHGLLRECLEPIRMAHSDLHVHHPSSNAKPELFRLLEKLPEVIKKWC